MMKWAIYLQLILISCASFAQIVSRNDMLTEMDSRDVGLDIPSINNWIEIAQSQENIQSSADNLMVLLHTMPGNYYRLFHCNGSSNLSKKKFYEISLSHMHLKSIMKFLRNQIEFIEKSFTPFLLPSVTERRQAAVSGSFACLEEAQRNGQNEADWIYCKNKFIWSQPLMSEERANKALIAISSIQRLMAIISCSDITANFQLYDNEMENDFLAAKKIFDKYFVGSGFPYRTENHLTRWFNQFHQ